jgi:3',5'-cyclic AMP phosphodiesterase CpdA
MPKKAGGGKLNRVIAVLLFLIAITIVIIYIFSQTLVNSLGVGGLDAIFNLAKNKGANLLSEKQPNSNADVQLRFALLSDSHEDTAVYPAIVEQISARGDLSFVAHLGDLSNAGEIEKLQESKSFLDRIAVPVYVLPGDHDLNWVPRHDLTNFRQVFGLNRTSYAFTSQGYRFLFIDNSDSTKGISSEVWQWLEQELEQQRDKQVYVFMSTPLSNPYLSFKTMGSQSDSVKQQGVELAALLNQYNVRVIFAGDTHTFSQYKDEETGLPIVTVGAAGTNKNPLPLYVEVEILSDGSYNIKNIPYDNNEQ